jgi:hypothetical protein
VNDLKNVSGFKPGPLPKTPRGKEYLLVITYYFTKWLEAFSLSNMKANTIAKILVEIFCRFGALKKINLFMKQKVLTIPKIEELSNETEEKQSLYIISQATVYQGPEKED